MTEEKEQLMERLFHDNYEHMYRFAYALLHDNEEARDAVSDVFSHLWDKLQGDADMELLPSTATAYLMRSVRNTCLNIISKKTRDERLKNLLPIAEPALSDDDTRRTEERWQSMTDCIDHRLTPQTASVIRLCYSNGLTYREAADELGISLSAVNKHIVNGLRLLRKLLNTNE